jgi:transcriptional regulator with XRE-family HTH domain
MDFIDIENSIKELAKDEGITIKNLCSQIGMTEQGFATSLKNQTLKIETLEKIAKIFDVPLSYFFGEDYQEMYESLTDKIYTLKKYVRKMALKGKGVIDIEFTLDEFELDFAELKEKVYPSYFTEHDKLFEEIENKELEELEKENPDK